MRNKTLWGEPWGSDFSVKGVYLLIHLEEDKVIFDDGAETVNETNTLGYAGRFTDAGDNGNSE